MQPRRHLGLALAALLLVVATSWPAAAKEGPAADAAGSRSPLLATVDVALEVDQVLDVGSPVAGAAGVELALEAPRSWTFLADLARFAEDAKWRLEVDVQGLAGRCLEPSARLKTRVRGYQLSRGGNEAVKNSLIPYAARDCEPSRTSRHVGGVFLTTDPLGYVDGPNLYQFAGNNPVNYGDPMGLSLQVHGSERAALTNFYGEGNVFFDEVGPDLYSVSISEAGLAHISDYVRRTGGSSTFARKLNQAILTPLYQYSSLASVHTGERSWIGGGLEGTRVLGMPEGWAIDHPDGAHGTFGSSFGDVPMSPWGYTRPGMVQGFFDELLSPEMLLLIVTVASPAPGDERLATGLVTRQQASTANLVGPRAFFEIGDVLPNGRIAGLGPGAAGTVRLRHFTSRSGLRGIQEAKVIRASDQNSVFTVRARGRVGSARDLESSLGIRRGRANAYVEFDAFVDEVVVVRNPLTGTREFVIRGNVDLSTRNPTFHRNN